MLQKLSILVFTFIASAFFSNTFGQGDPRNPRAKADTLRRLDRAVSGKIKALKTQLPMTCTECETSETEGEAIDRFRRVVKNYRTKVWDSINNTARFSYKQTRGQNFAQLDVSNGYAQTDARAIWFSLEQIKEFICTIEKYNAKLQVPAQNLGIRFYYAVYDADDTSVNKRDRHTLFMVPTRRNGNGPEEDFDPRATALLARDGIIKSEKVVTFYELLTEQYPTYRRFKALAMGEGQRPAPARVAPYGQDAAENVNNGTVSSNPNLVKNNGELCPPNCSVTSTLKAIDQ